jgi:hypothetical protein
MPYEWRHLQKILNTLIWFQNKINRIYKGLATHRFNLFHHRKLQQMWGKKILHYNAKWVFNLQLQHYKRTKGKTQLEYLYEKNANPQINDWFKVWPLTTSTSWKCIRLKQKKMHLERYITLTFIQNTTFHNKE